METPHLIPVYMDFCFKQVFSDKDILINFLSNTLLNWPFAPIVDLEFLDRELTKDAAYDKESRLDLKVKTQSGELIDLEIQVKSVRGYKERSLYYWAKIYESQLHGSAAYCDLKPVVCVNILVEKNPDFLDSSPYRSYSVREDHPPHDKLAPTLSIHFIELSKFKDSWEESNDFNNWLVFLKRPQEAQMHPHQNPFIEKALKKLEVLSHDPTMRVEYEAKQKFIRDYMWELTVAKEDAKAEGVAQGISQGISQGVVKGKLEIARKMIEKGMPIETVVEISELSLQDVLKLQSSL